jgi:hypothetical protein
MLDTVINHFDMHNLLTILVPVNNAGQGGGSGVGAEGLREDKSRRCRLHLNKLNNLHVNCDQHSIAHLLLFLELLSIGQTHCNVLCCHMTLGN